MKARNADRRVTTVSTAKRAGRAVKVSLGWCRKVSVARPVTLVRLGRLARGALPAEQVRPLPIRL